MSKLSRAKAEIRFVKIGILLSSVSRTLVRQVVSLKANLQHTIRRKIKPIAD
jgi:hypothetical protein